MELDKFLFFSWPKHLVDAIASNPVLLRTKYITVFYYGIFMGLAFCMAKLIAIYYISHQYPNEVVQSYLQVISYFMFPLGIVGARIMSWVFEDNFSMSQLFRPGFWWHGGLIGVMLGTLIGSYIKSLSVVALLDSFGAAMPAFEIFNRLGCLSYGCCWGREAPHEHPHAIRFKNQHSCICRKDSDCKDKFLYPVQVYAVILSALQLLTTIYIFQFNVNAEGFLFLFGMATSSVVRLICERFRGDFRGSGMGSTQAFAAIQFLCSFAFLICKSHILYALCQETGLYNIEGVRNTFLGFVKDNLISFFGMFAVALFAYGIHIH
mmetsp:Transcript_17/g.33  ORF Transcript_17/g.33 Transcript_17/m.33 type:complete len:321 (+) Transcript_17:251-1213(+)